MNRKMRQILFVEDDEALAMGTTYALESEGLTVSRTPDCESARKWWQDHERECDLVSFLMVSAYPAVLKVPGTHRYRVRMQVYRQTNLETMIQK